MSTTPRIVANAAWDVLPSHSSGRCELIRRAAESASNAIGGAAVPEGREHILR